MGKFIILQYHNITNRFEIGGTWIPRKIFENHLKFLKNQGFNSPSLKEIFAYPNVKDEKVLITFDDGFSSIYKEAFPIMEKYDYRGAVFVITGYIGKKNLWDTKLVGRTRHLDWHELRELQTYGWLIGSHTHTHPDLTKLREEEIIKELETSKKILEDGLGTEISLFSYPYGKWDERVKETLRRAGYKRAFISSQFAGFDPFLIKRRGIYLIDWSISHKLENSFPLSYIENTKERTIQTFALLSVLVRHSKLLRNLFGLKISIE